ncbi:MAG: DNA gyrase inhibitor YacG [Minicystis sp.]
MEARASHPCPICGRPAPPREAEPKNPAFPFCSPACKLLDLGRWLDGSYRVPGPPVESTVDAEGLRLDRGDDE